MDQQSSGGCRFVCSCRRHWKMEIRGSTATGKAMSCSRLHWLSTGLAAYYTTRTSKSSWNLSRAALAALLALPLGACSGSTSSTKQTIEINADTYGDQWPFTIKGGVISCENVTKVDTFKQYAVLLTSDGVTYALNGAAATAMTRDGKDWKNIREISKMHPDAALYGTTYYMSFPDDWIQKGLKLCEKT